jgi:hypothetical protein
MKKLIVFIFLLPYFSLFAQEVSNQPIKIFNQGNDVMMSNDFYVPVFVTVVPKEFSGAIMPPETLILLQPKQTTEVFKVTPIGQGRWTAVWNHSYYFGNPNAPNVGIKRFDSFIQPKSVFGTSKTFRAPIFRSLKPFDIFTMQDGIVFNILKNEQLKRQH